MDVGTFNLYQTDLETTDYGKVLQKIIKKDGFSANLIENYNNDILNKIPEVITNTTFEIKKGTIHFEDVSFRKPMESEFDKELTPKKSREKILPYFGNLRFKMVLKPKPKFTIGGIPQYSPEDKEESEYVNSDCIPVMLGSKLCHLDGKTDTEKMEMGECFNDPLGYFIIKSERTIINQENLRVSIFLIYKTVDQIEGRITCPTTLGTMISIIYIGKNESLSVSVQHLRKAKPITVPIFQIFRLLSVSLDDALSMILSFFPNEDERNQAALTLQSSIAEYQQLIISGDDSQDVMINNLYERRHKIDSKVTRDNILKDIEKDLLSNISGLENKALHLAMYTSRMLQVMIGTRKLDDRDSWANKRVSTPGRSIYQLFKNIWANMIAKLTLKTKDSINLKDVTSKFNVSEIRENFIKAFGSNSWGVAGAQKKENIVDSLKRETPLGVYAQMGRVKPPGSMQAKSVEPRMPHGSQIGYLCLYETPDGEGCGIVKNVSATCYLSLDRDPAPIINLIHNDKQLSKYCFINKTDFNQYALTVNGIIEAWCQPKEAEEILKQYKRKGLLYKDICIFRNDRDLALEIFCDGGRPTRPLFIVDKDTGELIIDQKKLWKADIDTLLKENCIEYIDAREQEWILLAQNVDEVRFRLKLLEETEKLKNIKNKTTEQESQLEKNLAFLSEYIAYTHCEIDPVAIFSIAGNLVPRANGLAGPRIGYQIGMSRQALSQYHSNEYLRFDSSYKMIYYPCKPIFQNDMQDTAGLNLMPNGTMINMAYLALPDNPEDGVVMKEELVKYNNKFDFCKKFLVPATLENSSSSSIYVEKFGKPTTQPGESSGKYDALDEHGIPKLDKYVRPGDCIICKIRTYRITQGTREAGTEEVVPICAGIGEEGFIDRVLITTDRSTNKTIVRVKIRQNRKYGAGDKLALRYAQKGTVARVIPARDMPRVATGPLKGMTPDIIVNPHNVSRMTITMMVEILVSKAAVIEGRYINSTSFRNFDEEIKHAQKVLANYGLDPMGKEDFELPNGRRLKNRVYFGPCFYQSLKHHVADKIQMRSIGRFKPSTHQPLQGRANEGGLKVGEMERDALISHGASALLRERLCDVSDVYNLPICGNCGTIAITNHITGENKCNICGPKSNIGVIRIPYVIKLLLFYLNAAGIHMTFKTSEISNFNGRPEEKWLV